VVRRRDARLVPVAAAAWAAAAFATTNPTTALPLAVGLWACAAGLLGLAMRDARKPARAAWTRGSWALVAVAVAVAAAAATNVAAAQPARAAAASLEIDGGRALMVDATAVGKIERSTDGWRFDATLRRVRYGSSERGAVSFGEAGVPVLVRIRDRPAGLDLGAAVRLPATAWPAGAGRREVLVIDATGAVEIIRGPAAPLAVAAALRDGLRAATASLPPPGSGLVAGLAVGDTTAVGDDLDAAMKAASLSHLTAVSGANCALVVALAYGAAALCRARRGIRVAAGCVALVGFVVLVSPEPSVVRAGAMAAIAMLGLLLGRPGAGLSLLACAVIVLLLIDPWLSLSLGFALSSVATASLVVGAGPLADGLARWMPRTLALIIAVPLAAQLACGPLIALISPQLSVYGVVANLVAAPAAPAATVLGLAACLTAGIPLLGSGLAALAWVPAAWIAGTAETFSTLPGSVVDVPEGPGGLVIVALLGAAVTAIVVPTSRRVRATAATVLAAAVVVGLAMGPIARVVTQASIPSAWSVLACDVGQGDAVLVRSAGVIALVDTGPDPDALTRCLDAVAITRVDLLVLTHFDLDHRGGVDAVVGRVGTVLHGPTDGADDEALIARLEAAGAVAVTGVRGMGGDLGESRWRVLWPNLHTPPGNDASVVVEWRGGGVPTAILLGDLSAEGQQAMAVGASLRGGYDVVKGAHHGSADQHAALYRALQPAVALVTVGENDYGHPRDETLDLLTGLGAVVARTDDEGMLAVWRDAEGLRLWRERAPADVDGGR